MRKIARRILHSVPVALWRRLFPKSELGICYHVVSDAGLPHVKHYRFLDPVTFEADLAYLQRRFPVTSYRQLVRRRESSGAIRDNSVILTFDDGFTECAEIVAPILRRRGLDCVFFVVTDLIDNTVPFRESEASLCIDALCKMPFERVEAIIVKLGLTSRLQQAAEAMVSAAEPASLQVAGLDCCTDARLHPLLNWLLGVGETDRVLLRDLCTELQVDPDAYLQAVQPYLTTGQIRRLSADGFTIGAHSCSHRWLQDLPLAEAEAEIVESCRIVRDLTGQDSVPFAFPYFGGGMDRAWLAQLRRKHQFIGLFFDTDGLREDERFVVQRVFGERLGQDKTVDAILRRAWARRPAWYWHR